MSLEALLVTKPLGVTSKIPPAKPGDIYWKGVIYARNKSRAKC